jgi:hypothetical protein
MVVVPAEVPQTHFGWVSVPAHLDPVSSLVARDRWGNDKSHLPEGMVATGLNYSIKNLGVKNLDRACRRQEVDHSWGR